MNMFLQLFQQERSRRGIGSTSIVTSGPDGKYTPLYGETPPSINSRSAVLKNGRNSTARDMFLAFDEKTVRFHFFSHFYPL